EHLNLSRLGNLHLFFHMKNPVCGIFWNGTRVLTCPSSFKSGLVTFLELGMAWKQDAEWYLKDFQKTSQQLALKVASGSSILEIY
ncbi:hypothetical protein STEG23_005519, partial [Scotinomys teguina]